MKKSIKLFLLSFFIYLFACFGIVSAVAVSSLATQINVTLEAQENSTSNKIRYISTITPVTDLNNITSISLELRATKDGSPDKTASVPLNSVYDEVTGTNGKEKVANTYYSVYTITDLTAFAGWTLNVNFAYTYSDSSKESTNEVVFEIPSTYTILSKGSGSIPTVSGDSPFAENIQDGQILQCFCWSYNEIIEYLPKIAEQGFTAIQTSPVQVCKEQTVDDGKGNPRTAKGMWWAYYQPAAFTLDDTGDNALGTPEQFANMVATAHLYGVKVMVDVVANHLGNQWVADSLCERAYYYEWEIAGLDKPVSEGGVIPYTGQYWSYKGGAVDADDPNASTTPVIDTYYYADTIKFHPYSIQDNDQAGNVTQGNIGMMDLDTSDPVVQDAVADYLEELIAYGVDGFRFDAAKHIETPWDDISSDFWPTVMGRANAAAAKLGKNIYAYGEILNRQGIGRKLSWYTNCGVNITDSGMGHNIVENGGKGFSTFNYADDENYGDYSKNMVVWAESHDNYMGTQDTHNKSVTIINRSYAILSARKDFATLYCARFEDYLESYLGSVACENGWSYAEVGAVNKFHNYFAKKDADERCFEENNYTCIERHNNSKSSDNGIVIVGDPGAMSVSCNYLADGTYTDAVSGNTFTVSGGTISGTVGESNIAVIYNSSTTVVQAPTVTPSVAEGSFTSDTLTVAFNLKNATSATMSINGGEAFAITSGAQICFGATMEIGDSFTITIAATDGTKNINKTYTYTKKGAPEETKVYFENNPGWDQVYCYMWSSSAKNAAWPGLPMTYDSEKGLWYISYMEDTYDKVIFNNNNNGEQTVNLTLDPDSYNTYSTTTSATEDGTKKYSAETSMTGDTSCTHENYTYMFNETTHWKVCDNCSKKFNEASHTWDSGEVTTPATSTTTGVMTYTCTVCNKTKTEDIPMIGHEAQSSWSHDANTHYHACTTDGCEERFNEASHTWDSGIVNGDVKTYTCTVCGETKDEEIVTSTRIYFTNNNNWSTVYVHSWNSENTKNTTEWPGNEMTYLYTNSMGQKIYYIDIDSSHNMIIFNSGGGQQTIDISLSDYTTTNAFYISGGSGTTLTVGTWNYEA